MAADVGLLLSRQLLARQDEVVGNVVGGGTRPLRGNVFGEEDCREVRAERTDQPTRAWVRVAWCRRRRVGPPIIEVVAVLELASVRSELRRNDAVPERSDVGESVAVAPCEKSRHSQC